MIGRNQRVAQGSLFSWAPELTVSVPRFLGHDGGKLYLSAYARRLGATGRTFYDDDVTAFFSPHAAGKSIMFLTALGRSAKRNAQRGQR